MYCEVKMLYRRQSSAANAVDPGYSFTKQFEEMKALILSMPHARETYTVEQAAERIGRRPWTVRQWCNLGQVPGAMKKRGRGKTGEWVLPHEVVLWLEREGPLPLRECLTQKV